MTINKTANPGQNISFSDIENEFGQNNGRDLGEYRVSQTVGEMNNLPLDDDIPQSGSISFGDFAQKQLNVIVHYSGTQIRPSTGRQKYSANSDVTVIGGFKGRPSNSSGTRVVLHVSGTIGSSKDSQVHCALRTGGAWESGTELEVNVGGEGLIIGAGGNGGDGSNDYATEGENGKPGSSALGIAYTVDKVVVQGGGAIRAGGGGGAGGGASREDSATDRRTGAGGGGGGGAGYPAGNAGSGKSGVKGGGSEGGENGTITDGGDGGEGGNNDNEARGGGGGGGGAPGGEVGEGGEGGDNSSETDGEEGQANAGGEGGNGKATGGEKHGESNGGEGGANGYAIIVKPGVNLLSTSGSISGNVQGGLNFS
tara:strand:- start:964 stop:2067 length:1104 start_codon:yes stop_codon:yes gene_type:complete